MTPEPALVGRRGSGDGRRVDEVGARVGQRLAQLVGHDGDDDALERGLGLDGRSRIRASDAAIDRRRDVDRVEPGTAFPSAVGWRRR